LNLKANFETGFSHYRLKGAFMLWVKWIQLVQPHLGGVLAKRCIRLVVRQAVVAQAESESKL
jgi:hypothetical protein